MTLLAELTEARQQADHYTRRLEEWEDRMATNPHYVGEIADEHELRAEDAGYWRSVVDDLERRVNAPAEDWEWSGDRLLDGAETDLFGRRAS